MSHARNHRPGPGKKTEDVKVERVEEVTTELAKSTESTEQKEVNFNQLKSKKKR